MIGRFIVVLAVAIGGSASHGHQQAEHADLRLRAARIVELFDPPAKAAGPGGGRRSQMAPGSRVAFSLEFDGPASCGAAANPAYLFLIDSDRSMATGGRTQAVPELGIDWKVEIRCDPATGRFVSPLGAVEVRAATADSPRIIEVITPAGVLPTERFHWVVVALDGSRFVRLPEAGKFEAWRPVREWLK